MPNASTFNTFIDSALNEALRPKPPLAPFANPPLRDPTVKAPPAGTRELGVPGAPREGFGAVNNAIPQIGLAGADPNQLGLSLQAPEPGPEAAPPGIFSNENLAKLDLPRLLGTLAHSIAPGSVGGRVGKGIVDIRDIEDRQAAAQERRDIAREGVESLAESRKDAAESRRRLGDISEARLGIAESAEDRAGRAATADEQARDIEVARVKTLGGFLGQLGAETPGTDAHDAAVQGIMTTATPKELSALGLVPETADPQFKQVTNPATGETRFADITQPLPEGFEPFPPSGFAPKTGTTTVDIPKEGGGFTHGIVSVGPDGKPTVIDTGVASTGPKGKDSGGLFDDLQRREGGGIGAPAQSEADIRKQEVLGRIRQAADNGDVKAQKWLADRGL